MEKTYKRVPFDIELAKKIQSGEVEGRVITYNKYLVQTFYIDEDKHTILYSFSVKTAADKEGYESCKFMDAINKFLIELPEETPKNEFKPFDKVLVRRCKGDTGFLSSEWTPAFFQKHNDNFAFPFLASGMYWYECIHYEGNEHLVGTTNKPKED